MRIAIGWHFLYEGVLKLLDGKWSAAAYLRGSTGPLAEYFRQLAADPMSLRIVDQLNIWGLILVGLCLMLGLATRFAAFCGVVILALYYVAYPPLFQSTIAGMNEGHYLIVSKNLVEMLALCVVLVCPATAMGLDGFVWSRRKEIAADQTDALGQPIATAALASAGFSRRRIVAGLAGTPFIGAFVLAMLKKHSYEEKNLAANVDATSGATIKVFNFSTDLKNLKGTLAQHQGQIGKLKLSRMILGGNLIGGWAHARDLIYVSDLVHAYHTDEKVFQTFQLAEACGVNTFITNPVLYKIINDYRRTTGGKMQFISDCGGTPENLLELAQKAIDAGASACYVHGGIADGLVAKGQFDLIEKALELVRKNGLPAGIGGHKLETITTCVEKGFKPDFWMKTLHRNNYWSAAPKDECDNIWCQDAEKVATFMKDRPEPWIAFKVLAAGALHPKDAFRWAFANGADFICVGMYDFQMIEDVNYALDVLNQKLERGRAWYA
jgi:uncharacterized membrane protein YphA (DoxX/SURF4 family)